MTDESAPPAGSPEARQGRGVDRICFTLRVRPDRIAEYRERHGAVWPDMRAALAASGWRNYSIFTSDDGLVVGYLETDDFAAAQAAMARTEVNARWQAEIAPLLAGEADGRPADEALRRLTEVFHLD